MSKLEELRQWHEADSAVGAEMRRIVALVTFLPASRRLQFIALLKEEMCPECGSLRPLSLSRCPCQDVE